MEIAKAPKAPLLARKPLPPPFLLLARLPVDVPKWKLLSDAALARTTGLLWLAPVADASAKICVTLHNGLIAYTGKKAPTPGTVAEQFATGAETGLRAEVLASAQNALSIKSALQRLKSLDCWPEFRAIQCERMAHAIAGLPSAVACSFLPGLPESSWGEGLSGFTVAEVLAHGRDRQAAIEELVAGCARSARG